MSARQTSTSTQRPMFRISKQDSIGEVSQRRLSGKPEVMLNLPSSSSRPTEASIRWHKESTGSIEISPPPVRKASHKVVTPHHPKPSNFPVRKLVGGYRHRKMQTKKWRNLVRTLGGKTAGEMYANHQCFFIIIFCKSSFTYLKFATWKFPRIVASNAVHVKNYGRWGFH